MERRSAWAVGGVFSQPQAQAAASLGHSSHPLLQAAADAEAQAADPFYSPLRSHASQLSFGSAEAAGGSPASRQAGSPAHSPHSLRSVGGPLVADEDGTPRSPWDITHDRVFQSLDVGASESPLRSHACASPLLSPGRSPRGAARSPGRSPAGPAPPQVQRLPRRAQQVASPGGAAHRYPLDADADSPMVSPSPRRQQGPSSSSGGVVRVRRGELAGSRDEDTDAADAVHPAAGRAGALRNSAGSPKCKMQ